MILQGEQIQVAANRTEHPIELRDTAGKRVSVLDKMLLLGYVEVGYEVHGNKRRIRYLCPPGPKLQVRPVLPWESCWRTADAAVAWGYQDTPGIPA